jgi:hypothetical protein
MNATSISTQTTPDASGSAAAQDVARRRQP